MLKMSVLHSIISKRDFFFNSIIRTVFRSARYVGVLLLFNRYTYFRLYSAVISRFFLYPSVCISCFPKFRRRSYLHLCIHRVYPLCIHHNFMANARGITGDNNEHLSYVR